jgi:sigma-70-like protein
MVVRAPELKACGKQAEERLWVEAAQRDPARFAELYEANFERVYAYIARRVDGREKAEDLTSDVFRRALAALPRFEWRGVPFGGLAPQDRRKRGRRSGETLGTGPRG